MHEGHRNRLTSKIRNGGIVYKHELMEILLFNSCPRKDLNATAHKLVEKFGFEGVFKAGCAELSQVDGVGANMAEYIAVLGKSLAAVRDKECFAVVKNVQQFKKYILTRPVPEVESLELYFIDKDGRIRRICKFKAKAGFRAAPQDPEILKVVSAHSPYGIFAAVRRTGNRPADALDDTLSDRIYKIGVLCGARLYDYCVIGDESFYSYKMADRGVFADKGAGDGYGE